jgi:hypothetical protein
VDAASDDLARALERSLDQAQRAYAAYRPEVARYLFERGLRRTAEALGRTNDHEDRDALLTRVFRLQLETIGSRAFGVSSDRWRDDPTYPDRYFPVIWLDVLPALLPLLPPERRLPTVVGLFNLGENLVVAAPSLGGLVADALSASVDAIAREGLERVALAAMARLGILPAEAVCERQPFTGVERLAVVSVASWEPTMIPGALSFVSEATLRVADRRQPFALQLGIAGAAVRLVAREPLAAVPEVVTLPAHGVSRDGTVTWEGRELGRIDPRGVASVAASPGGLLAVARRFSQRIELHAFVPSRS